MMVFASNTENVIVPMLKSRKADRKNWFLQLNDHFLMGWTRMKDAHVAIMFLERTKQQTGHG